MRERECEEVKKIISPVSGGLRLTWFDPMSARRMLCVDFAAVKLLSQSCDISRDRSHCYNKLSCDGSNNGRLSVASNHE